jgi:hypothetical protein
VLDILAPLLDLSLGPCTEQVVLEVNRRERKETNLANWSMESRANCNVLTLRDGTELWLTILDESDIQIIS